jgi:hypothetical protein
MALDPARTHDFSQHAFYFIPDRPGSLRAIR